MSEPRCPRCQNSKIGCVCPTTLPHVYDYGEGGPVVPAHPEIAVIKETKPEPGVYDLCRAHPINIDNLPDHVKGCRYVAQCNKCARWVGGSDYTHLHCAWCKPEEYRRECYREQSVKTDREEVVHLQRVLATRNGEIIQLRAALADVAKERDQYKARIDKATRTLEGF